MQGNTKVLGDRPKDKILEKCIIYSCTLNFLIVFDDYMTLRKSKWTYLTDFRTGIYKCVWFHFIIRTDFSLIVFPREGKEEERRGEGRGRKEHHPDSFPL